MRRPLAALAVLAAICAACSSAPGTAGTPASGHRSAATTLRSARAPARRASSYRFHHVVVVIEENHSYSDIIGNTDAPYLNRLARHGLLFTRSHALTHPSQPNYVGLFAGSTRGVQGDHCLGTPLHRRNLGGELRYAGLTFVGYAQSLPATGSTECKSGAYARKHAPWTDFADLPGHVNRPFSDFPTHYGKLPRVSFVVPNLTRDMHNGSIKQADTWLQNHLRDYAHWARHHHSLLIVTWDEAARSSPSNHIPTIAYGSGIHAGRYRGHINHYRVLRTLEALYHLRALKHARHVHPIRALVRG
jgi:hypothetical protein